jgi:hypothetical protein
LFPISSIWRADHYASAPPRWFCTARASLGTESSDRIVTKTSLETIGEANSGRGAGAALMTSPMRNLVRPWEGM